VPTYQYACTACGEQHEAVQSFTDAPLTDCPACEGRLRKVFSAVGVVFKGSGFYKTDSRPGKDGGKGTGSGEGAAAKTDSAPAAKTDSGTAGKSDSSSTTTGGGSSSSTPAAKSA
jgi:putative FmdB family regulatory protein